MLGVRGNMPVLRGDSCLELRTCNPGRGFLMPEVARMVVTFGILKVNMAVANSMQKSCADSPCTARLWVQNMTIFCGQGKIYEHATSNKIRDAVRHCGRVLDKPPAR